MSDIFDIKMSGNRANDTADGSKNDWNMITHHNSELTRTNDRHDIELIIIIMG
jgi:hypothetical protein